MGMCKQTVVDIVWDSIELYHLVSSLVYFLGLGELPFSG
jgi:hypothetical protein